MTQHDLIKMSVALDDLLEAQEVNTNPFLLATIIERHGDERSLEELAQIYHKTIAFADAS